MRVYMLTRHKGAIYSPTLAKDKAMLSTYYRYRLKPSTMVNFVDNWVGTLVGRLQQGGVRLMNTERSYFYDPSRYMVFVMIVFTATNTDDLLMGLSRLIFETKIPPIDTKRGTGVRWRKGVTGLSNAGIGYLVRKKAEEEGKKRNISSVETTDGGVLVGERQYEKRVEGQKITPSLTLPYKGTDIPPLFSKELEDWGIPPFSPYSPKS